MRGSGIEHAKYRCRRGNTLLLLPLPLLLTTGIPFDIAPLILFYKLDFLANDGASS